MKLKFNVKKFLYIFGGTIIGLYVLFLAAPFVISPIANSYSDDIEKIIKDTTGLEAKLDGLGVTTSYKFDAGIKIKSFSLKTSESDTYIISAKNIKADIALLALLQKKVQLGTVNTKDLLGNIVVKKDGGFEILDYIPQSEEPAEPMKSLPYGLVLSNKLPDIHINNYKLAFIDATDNKEYYISGDNFKITDFILDKKIKVSANGKLVFDDRTVSNFDIKIFNKIMPNLKLDDLVFPKEVVSEDEGSSLSSKNMPTKANQGIDFSIIDIFKSVNKNQLKADLNADIKTWGSVKEPQQKGYIEVNGLSIGVNGQPLPDSFVKLVFKGAKTDIDSEIYSSSDKNEKTTISGNITSGRKKNIDVTLKSNAKFNNIIRLADSVAQSFGINDLKTVSATGGIDADFNIKSDLKTVNSNGYLKVNPSSLSYGLYNITVDKITADINCENNNINIKDSGFSILGHPLKLVGTISPEAVADLKLTAEKLSIKGLLGALGQVAILKENDINSGTISLNVLAKGKLDEIKPDVSVNIDSVNILNKASAFRILLTNAFVNLVLSQDALSGDIALNSLALKNSLASVSVPSAKITMDTKDINIQNSYVLINNSRVDVKGKVTDYTTDKLNMDIKASGNIASKDIAAFIPVEMRSMFPYAGTLPVNIVATGNDKEQNVSFDLSAIPGNYVKFADIDLLKGKTTKIHSNIKITNADNIKLSNTGIYANSAQIASVSGGVSNLSSPKLNLLISVPKKVSFPIWGMGNSNITAYGDVSITGDLMTPKLKGKVYVDDISIKDMDFVMTNLVANLNGTGISGNATADKMKFGGIVGTNLASKFSLNNFTDFYLNDITADAFSGKVSGKVSYNIPKFAFGADITGKNMNSTDAVYGAVGIPKALTGTLGFDAKLTGSGVTDTEIIKSMKGNINFNIDDGRFVSIGKLENLFAAQNITSNSLLKSAVSQLTTLSSLQESDKFKSITGNLTLSDGNATISPIKVSGPLMSYYVKGIFYILNNTANLTVLGRLDSKVISYLGPLGQLSADKLLSYIPKFGASTAALLNQMTSNPEAEKTDMIPALSGGSTSYKDFKVIFNGPVEKSSSVKSFKWLTTCDTTQINLKDEAKNAAQAVKTNVQNTITETKTQAENVKTNVTNTVNTTKQQVEDVKKSVQQTKIDIQNAKENAKQTVTNLGNLLKNAATNATKQPEITPTTETTPETTTTESDNNTTTQSQ